MCNESFYNKVRTRAYFKYLDRINNNLSGDGFSDWVNAETEEIIEERIREEAFLHSLGNGKDALTNFLEAKQEIKERIQFLAFYMHEANINRSALQNWSDAQKLYVDKY